MGSAVKPRRESMNVDSRSGGQMLEVRFCQAHIPTMTQAKGADTLGERAFAARSRIILRFPYQRTLLLSEGVQRLVFTLRFQRHMAGIRLGFGTLWTPITIPTVFIGELDTDDRILPPIEPCG